MVTIEIRRRDLCAHGFQTMARASMRPSRRGSSSLFHNTKAAGEGLGLGLATANRIVTDHHGRLSYLPSRLGGAGFRIELPRVEADRGRLRA